MASNTSHLTLPQPFLVRQSREELNQKDPEQLKKAIDSAIERLASSGQALGEIDRLAEMLDTQALQGAIKIASPQAVEALQEARDLFLDAQVFLEQTNHKINPTFKARIGSLLESILSVLESILSAFGLADFFKPAESDVHADFKGQKIMMLVSLFTLLSSVLLPFLGGPLAGAIIGGTLLAITALSLIYPHVKPTPFRLPHAINWTRQYSQGKLDVVPGRKKTVDEIAETLSANRGVKVHPLLIGKSGVGKTETAKALVEAIERGDYPELRGKRVFYLKTADLVSNSEMFSNNNRALLKIQEAIGSHSKNIILVFDEIHLACREKEYSAVGEQLKTLLDPGEGNFPYVIGITTEEDYYRDIFQNQAAFARRFKRIHVESTDEAETVTLLNRAFLRQAPQILLQEGVIRSLYQKTAAAYEDRAQPAQSLRILSSCIQRTQESQKSALEKRIEAVRSEIDGFHVKRAVEGPMQDSQIEELEATLSQLEEQFQKEQEEIASFFELRDRMLQVKEETFRTVLKIGRAGRSVFSAKEINRFLILHHFLAPAMKALVIRESARLGIRTTLDEELIDEVIQEDLEEEERTNRLIRQGKSQLAERAS